MYSYNSVPVYQTRTEDRETRPSLLKIIDFHSEMTSLTPHPLPSPPDRGWGGPDFTENVVKSALDWVPGTLLHTTSEHMMWNKASNRFSNLLAQSASGALNLQTAKPN